VHSGRGLENYASGRGVDIRSEGERNLMPAYVIFQLDRPTKYIYRTIGLLVMLLLLYSVPGCGSYSECLYFCDFQSYRVNQDGCNYRGSQMM
jgi:hypothetical protein